jgi:hypothetical protein
MSKTTGLEKVATRFAYACSDVGSRNSVKRMIWSLYRILNLYLGGGEISSPVESSSAVSTVSQFLSCYPFLSAISATLCLCPSPPDKMSTRSVPFAPTYEEVIWERTTESRISTVISLLPMSLQSRMSPFKSRRTASLGSLTTDGRLVCTSASTPSLPSEKPRSGLPGWGLTMRRSSGMVSSDGSTTPSSSDGEEAFSSGTVTPMREIALRPGSEPKGAGVGSPSGIRWKVANQGRISLPL